jgi:hypothetical protein
VLHAKNPNECLVPGTHKKAAPLNFLIIARVGPVAMCVCVKSLLI